MQIPGDVELLLPNRCPVHLRAISRLWSTTMERMSPTTIDAAITGCIPISAGTRNVSECSDVLPDITHAIAVFVDYISTTIGYVPKPSDAVVFQATSTLSPSRGSNRRWGSHRGHRRADTADRDICRLCGQADHWARSCPSCAAVAPDGCYARKSPKSPRCTRESCIKSKNLSDEIKAVESLKIIRL